MEGHTLVYLIFIAHLLVSVTSGASFNDGNADEDPDKAKNHVGNIPVVKASRKIDAVIKAKAVDSVSLNDIKPKDHIDGVPVEEDGDLNPIFQKEIFFGIREGWENAAYEEKLTKLKKMYSLVDFDFDKHLTEQEVDTWIKINVNVHISDGNTENRQIFPLLDKNKDGKISWEELLEKYLIAGKYIKEGDAIPKDPTKTVLRTQEDIDAYQKFVDRWDLSDEFYKDGYLTDREFLSFRHPEQNSDTRHLMAVKLIKRLDVDGDGKLSLDEFINQTPIHKGEEQETPGELLEKRRFEFTNNMDYDHDGFAEPIEIVAYTNPRNPKRSAQEAKKLIDVADLDGDRKLTFDEVEQSMDFILGTKLIDSPKNFHDEF